MEARAQYSVRTKAGSKALRVEVSKEERVSVQDVRSDWVAEISVGVW